MITNETEYQEAQREMQHLKDFLRRVEQSPEHPNKELSIVGSYKKMSSLWDELEEYYRAGVRDTERAAKAVGSAAARPTPA